MNNYHWREIERIFDEILELPEADRADFLVRVCNGDQTLQHEIESLLAAHQQANGFLVASASKLSPAQELPATLVAAQRLGSYQLLREIAQGGMGMVWLAERADDQFKQQVAIKLLKTDSPDIAHRLRHERQTLADLNRPNSLRTETRSTPILIRLSFAVLLRKWVEQVSNLFSPFSLFPGVVTRHERLLSQASTRRPDTAQACVCFSAFRLVAEAVIADYLLLSGKTE